MTFLWYTMSLHSVPVHPQPCLRSGKRSGPVYRMAHSTSLRAERRALYDSIIVDEGRSVGGAEAAETSETAITVGTTETVDTVGIVGTARRQRTVGT